MEDFFYPSADGFHSVHACIWRPEGAVKGVLQIIHGMEEHCERYSQFAEKAAEQGFLVCAEDHIGHGKTAAVGEEGHFPAEGEKIVLSDISELTRRAKELAPGVPFFVLGHSMGSFFCREYIARSGSQFDGAIIMGTGYKGRVTLTAALALTKIVQKRKGIKYKSAFIARLAFGSYNKKFRPAPTGFEWLSADAQNVNAYVSDPMCGFGFTCGGYCGLFRIIKAACSKEAFASVPKDLPVLIVSGSDDPVGGYGKGVKNVYKKYKKAGVKKVELILYPGARHEILNDICKDAAAKDILAFVKAIASEAQN